MTLVYFLDEDGFIDQVDNVLDPDSVSQKHTTIALPAGLHKPKFNGQDWVETMDDDEYEAIITQSKQVKPSEAQLQFQALRAMIVAQNKQIQALKGKN